MSDNNDLQRIGDAVVSLARAEERLASIEQIVNSTLSKINTIDERVRKLEQETHDNSNMVKTISRVFWTIASSIITAGIGTLFFFLR
jgi:septation ring formation regulator EzrA